MIINVTSLGVGGFYIYRDDGGPLFRPCATRCTVEDAIEATRIELQEILLISRLKFTEVLFGGRALGDFILPIHFHPFMWQKRTLKDVDWYNKRNVPYTPFYHYKTNKIKYLPKELTVYDEAIAGKGLTFCSQEGYSYDSDFELAKVKAVMELIEKDVITLWWHRETDSEFITIDDAAREDVLEIKNSLLKQGFELTILNLKNDLGVYVIVCILKQSEYPKITYGSSAHFDINEAVKHSIFEAISCIAGLRYEFIHFKKINNDISYPEFILNNAVVKLSQQQEVLGLNEAITRYNIYYSYTSNEEGYLVKAYSFELQSTLYCETVPLTKRFFSASEGDVVIKDTFPFL